MLPFPTGEEEEPCCGAVVGVEFAWVVGEGCGEEVDWSGVLVGVGVDEDEVGVVEGAGGEDVLGGGSVDELGGVETGVDEGGGEDTDPPPGDWVEDMMTENERKKKSRKKSVGDNGEGRERKQVPNPERIARAGSKRGCERKGKRTGGPKEEVKLRPYGGGPDRVSDH